MSDAWLLENYGNKDYFSRHNVVEPHGESAKGSKRSLYKIDDPFLRMWFRVVAPNRAALTAGTPASRAAVLDEHWHLLLGQA